MAKSSMSEAEYYIHLAQQLGYLKDKESEPITVLQSEAARTLYGLIHWLEDQIAKGKVSKKDLEQQSARSEQQ